MIQFSDQQAIQRAVHTAEKNNGGIVFFSKGEFLVHVNPKKANPILIHGSNLEARSKMAWGQFIAGQAFSNAGLGFVHSMAHQLGGVYDLPHGVANAVLLPHVEKFNIPSCAHKLKKVARAMGVGVIDMSDEEGANAAIEAIKKLSKAVGIPSGLKELGVKEEDFEEMAKNALADVCTGGNPREVTIQDTIDIYRAAM
jgi:alcohol dehydrogenase